MQQTPNSIPQSAVMVASIARKAMGLMEEQAIPPNPENFALWYHYAEGTNAELVRELDTLIKNKIPFTASNNASLYTRFIIDARNEKIMSGAAAGASKLLTEVLRSVNQFGSETKSYNKDVSSYIEKMPVDIDDPDMRGIVRELIAASVKIGERGHSLNLRLEESKAEIEGLRKDLELVTNESQKDFLTNVFNRKAFDRLLEEQLALAKAQHQELCLLMLDIDHFKQFNDKFGHLLGDEVLKIVSRTMMDCVRGQDIVARYGGEEFSLILPSTPLAGGIKVAESIRQAIAKRELKRRDTGENYGALTISVGVAEYRPQSDNPLSLIKRADEALYHSKRHGRNRVTGEEDVHI